MIHIEDSIIMDELLEHVGKERARAKLTDKPFVLGIATDIRPSQISALVHNQANEATLKEIGMAEYKFHWDALRSNMRLGGEELIISICGAR
jgi:hypothetical protein